MRFSIIIATCDRPKQLKCTLDAVGEAISASRENHELIVVDNGFCDDVSSLVKSLSLDAGFLVRYIKTEPGCKSIALNAGIDAAIAEWIAFTDDDALPNDDWLVEASHQVETGTVDLFGGKIVPGPVGDNAPYWLRSESAVDLLRGPAIVSYKPMDSSGIITDEMPVPLGANFFVKKSVFDLCGKYDVSLWQKCGKAALGCEDAEFAMRVRANGVSIGYSAEAKVMHPVAINRATFRHHVVWSYNSGLRENILFSDEVESRVYLCRRIFSSGLSALVKALKMDTTGALNSLMNASFSVGQMNSVRSEKTNQTLSLVKKWFPSCSPSGGIRQRLEMFYEENEEYHAMTAAVDKVLHPQVRILDCLISPQGKYAEIGCGGGAVACRVAETAEIVGFDVSSVAIQKSKDMNTCNAEFICSEASNIPAPDNTFDGVYSFEMLEHVWEPLDAISEMVRITKPNGFVLISVPLLFSLDFQLQKRPIVRLSETIMAGLRYMHDKLKRSAFYNVEPDLEGDIYPDCDLITAFIPENLVAEIEAMGCEVEFWDTTYMAAHKEGSGTDLKFQKRTSSRFFRNYGDHLLLLARKI